MDDTPNITKERILRLAEVKARTGLSRSTIYLWVNESRFPKPIKLTDEDEGRAVGWLESEISEWVKTRIELSRPTAPECK